MSQDGSASQAARTTTAATATATATATAAAQLEQQVRARIESMSYLPTTVAVAMKFIQLGKNPDAEPNEYGRVISSDSSLSSKLLSLANSSWFGVRNKVTKVQVAVNLLGLGTVRTLAISYCLTGLHNELRLSPEESRIFWTASLCKAVAAKCFAAIHDPKQAEEAFAAGLFQDFAMPVMYSTAKEPLLALLQDATLDRAGRVEKERAVFRLDHAETGRAISQKLELPELFVDAVAFHHDHASLREFTDKPVIADAAYLASLFPHYMDVWNGQDADEMRKFLAEHGGAYAGEPDKFLELVQKEFNTLYCYFEQGEPPEIKLTELLENATREMADSTTRLVGTMHELLQQVAVAGKEVHQLLKTNDELEQAASRDGLTGALNREGFVARVEQTLRRLQACGSGYALAYLDIDKFKQINDAGGHQRGDDALQMVATTMQQNVRANDVIGRMGGDEFAILLADCTSNNALQVIQRILADIVTKPIGGPTETAAGVTLSAGLVWMAPKCGMASLEKLLAIGDTLMYEAKRGGGNRVQCRSIQPAKREVA